MENKSIVIQEPLLIEEAEKIFKAFYEYKSKEGIYIYMLGNLEIKEIKIPEEIKVKEDFQEILVRSINEAIVEVNKCTQNELQAMLMENMGE